MESSSFSGGHIRIRKLKLKSGAGPESLCFKLQRQAVLWLVRLGILSQCCYWELGTEVHSPRCGIHIPLRCCPLPSGRVPEGCSKLATPNPYPVLGQFLRFGVSCNVPSHFTAPPPPGLHPSEIPSGILCFCKTRPSGHSFEGNFCCYRSQKSPEQGAKHRYLTICWEEREQRNKN